MLQLICNIADIYQLVKRDYAEYCRFPHAGLDIIVSLKKNTQRFHLLNAKTKRKDKSVCNHLK